MPTPKDDERFADLIALPLTRSQEEGSSTARLVWEAAHMAFHMDNLEELDSIIEVARIHRMALDILYQRRGEVLTSYFRCAAKTTWH